MKKILFLHSSAELYGSDRSLLNIITNIDKNEFEIHVMLPCDGPLVTLLSQIPNVTVSIFDFAVLRRKMLSIGGGISYVISFLKSKRHIKKYIKENKIDVVYTNTSVIFPGAIAAKASKIKSVWHVREIIKSNTENKVVSAIIKRYADVVIANSKETANALLVPQEKIRVIYNAVSEKEDSQIKEHSPLTVGMAGRINRWKGQKLFVDAAEIVHKKIPDAVFKIAGAAYTGEEFLEEELKQYIKETKEKQALAKAKIKKLMPSIVNSSMTELQKVIAIHDWIVINMDYAYNDYKNGTIKKIMYSLKM